MAARTDGHDADQGASQGPGTQQNRLQAILFALWTEALEPTGGANGCKTATNRDPGGGRGEAE